MSAFSITLSEELDPTGNFIADYLDIPRLSMYTIHR